MSPKISAQNLNKFRTLRTFFSNSFLFVEANVRKSEAPLNLKVKLWKFKAKILIMYSGKNIRFGELFQIPELLKILKFSPGSKLEPLQTVSKFAKKSQLSAIFFQLKKNHINTLNYTYNARNIFMIRVY